MEAPPHQAALLAIPDRLAADTSGLFLLWEIRGVLRAAGASIERIDLDGGCRVERDGRAAGRATAAFVVGAGPSALEPLADGRDWLSPRVADEWSAASAWLTGQLRAHQEGVLGAAAAFERGLRKAGACPGPLVTSVYSRARAWSRSPGAPQCELAVGFRVRGEWSRDRAVGRIETSFSDPDHAPWSADPSGFDAELAERVDEAAGIAPARPTPTGFDDYSGPAILLGSAAGWLAHELGHAALERPRVAPPDGSAGPRIDDDPAAAPWPAGFAWDDAGFPSNRAVLWDGGGAHRPAPEGRLRRASVRDAPAPFLSCTTLVTEARASRAALAVSAGAPVIVGVRSGRYDPGTDIILLEADQVVVREGNAWALLDGGACIAVTADEAWSGLRVDSSHTRCIREHAACTRQGSTIAVMVGAQTIALDSVHLTAPDGAS